MSSIDTINIIYKQNPNKPSHPSKQHEYVGNRAYIAQIVRKHLKSFCQIQLFMHAWLDLLIWKIVNLLNFLVFTCQLTDWPYFCAHMTLISDICDVCLTHLFRISTAMINFSTSRASWTLNPVFSSEADKKKICAKIGGKSLRKASLFYHLLYALHRERKVQSPSCTICRKIKYGCHNFKKEFCLNFHVRFSTNMMVIFSHTCLIFQFHCFISSATRLMKFFFLMFLFFLFPSSIMYNTFIL